MFCRFFKDFKVFIYDNFYLFSCSEIAQVKTTLKQSDFQIINIDT